MFELEGKRKFLIMLVALAISIIFLLTKHLSDDNFALILSTSLPAFFAANGVEHFMKKKK